MIVSSTYRADNHEQIDGRRYVTEYHEWDDGSVTLRAYLAPVGADYARIAERAARTLEATAAQEADTVAVVEYEARALERGKIELAKEGDEPVIRL